jgi:hypothetical protein
MATSEANAGSTELQNLDESLRDSSGGRQEFSLPPADGGKAAWLFLGTCFFVEAFVWGECYFQHCYLPLTKTYDV